MICSIHDLVTPALIVDQKSLESNLRMMAEARPGGQLRPHVKAHKCSELARQQASLGNAGFTCATPKEAVGLMDAGLGDDLLLANEVLDLRLLRELKGRVMVAVDSSATVRAAANSGVRDVLIDVNVGLPRCGCRPQDAEQLAREARSLGCNVRGVMGYEGHAMLIPERKKREQLVCDSMDLLAEAHSLVGGDVISAGGTGSYDCNQYATEIQAGSYALMDTAYAKLDLPFQMALSIYSTVISVSENYVVADCGLKALGMDHGNPNINDGTVWFCSDEHITFKPDKELLVGDKVRVWPAHIDPTAAYHEFFHIVDGETVVEQWPIDLRGWLCE